MLAQSRVIIAKELILTQGPLKELSQERIEQIRVSSESPTVIIDYGSENIKAGLTSHGPPQVVFRSQVSKNRDANRPDISVKAYINTSYDQIDFAKSSYKSPYERNLILHFGLIEQCNDYILGELTRPEKRIRNSLILSEPMANPQHCRGSLLQQFFECYQIERVFLGTDLLFGYFYEVDCNMNRYQTETALVVQMGANTIHVMAIVRGRPDYSTVRRINVGGNQAFEVFSKSILLKNPHLKDRLTYTLLRYIFEEYTAVAIDYRQQLAHFESKFKPPKSNVYRNRIEEANKNHPQQLSFIEGIEIDFEVPTYVPEEQLRRKEEVRKRMSEKLKQTLARRKDMKRQMHQVELKNLQQLKQRYQSHDKFAHEEAVQMFGQRHPHDKLLKKIHMVEVKLGLVEEKAQQSKFSLINVPDHELPPQKLKYKKLQIYQKQAIQARRQRQKEKQEEENRMKELRQNNPQVYLQQLKQKYQERYAKFKQKQRIKTELSNRKSNLKQRQRLAFTRLAEQDYDPDQQLQGDDWLAVHDPNESDHGSELEAMEAELREIDPEWTQAKDDHHLKETNQVFLQTDLVKCHEIYFQPMMIGVNQLDLISTITQMLSTLPSEVAHQLRANVVLIGGGSQVQGLQERIRRDLVRESPCDSKIGVRVGKGGANGAYLAMQNIARDQTETFNTLSLKRGEYLTQGSSVFTSNPWSNPAL